jgi:hypothetical protein
MAFLSNILVQPCQGLIGDVKDKAHKSGLFDAGRPFVKTIGAAYSPIKNRDYPAVRLVIASSRFMRYLKLPFPPEADSRYAPAKVGHGNQMDR